MKVSISTRGKSNPIKFVEEASHYFDYFEVEVKEIDRKLLEKVCRKIKDLKKEIIGLHVDFSCVKGVKSLYEKIDDFEIIRKEFKAHTLSGNTPKLNKESWREILSSYKNLFFEPKSKKDLQKLKEIGEEIGRPVAIFDLGDMYKVFGNNIYTELKKFQKSIGMVHISDSINTEYGIAKNLPLGMGEIDFKKVISLLREKPLIIELNENYDLFSFIISKIKIEKLEKITGHEG